MTNAIFRLPYTPPYLITCLVVMTGAIFRSWRPCYVCWTVALVSKGAADERPSKILRTAAPGYPEAAVDSDRQAGAGIRRTFTLDDLQIDGKSCGDLLR